MYTILGAAFGGLAGSLVRSTGQYASFTRSLCVIGGVGIGGAFGLGYDIALFATDSHPVSKLFEKT